MAEPSARLVALGLRIAKLRREKGWTQQQLADVTGLSRSSVANIETGRQEISVTHLWAFTDALGSTVAEVTETPPMPWLELARRVTRSEREYADRAEDNWRRHHVLAAVRWRGVAEGLAIARAHQLGVVGEMHVQMIHAEES